MKDFDIQRLNGYFKCNQCLWSSNADLVGAINIGKKYLVEELYPAEETLLRQALKRGYYYYKNDLYERQLKKNPQAKKPEETDWEWIKNQPISKTNGNGTNRTLSLDTFKLNWFMSPHAVPQPFEYWTKSIRNPPPVILEITLIN